MKMQVLAICLLAQITVSLAAKCSFYGSEGETGSQTANGEPFNANALACATTPHVPLGSVLQVTNQRTGRSITVRVNDRLGSAPAEDTIDLTYGAFGQLEQHDSGIFPCTYTVV